MKFSLMLLVGIQYSQPQAFSSCDVSNAHITLKKDAQRPIEASGHTNLATQHNIPQYSRAPVILSKTYSGYVKPRIIPNAIYNVIFV
jgi:hypothetical protein